MLLKQRKRSDMDPEDLKTFEDALRGIQNNATTTGYKAKYDRYGILKMTDAYGNPRTLRDHQVISVCNLMSQQLDTAFERRKSGILDVHATGAGKTITAFIKIASIYANIPDLTKFKALVVTPKSVVHGWAASGISWLNIPEDEILMATNQSQLTTEAIERAKLIIVNIDTLKAAFATFMWDDKKKESAHNQEDEDDDDDEDNSRFVRGINPSHEKRMAKFAGRRPPVHPLFQFMEHNKGDYLPFTCTVVDEVHLCSNPTTWGGHIVNLLSKRSMFNIGLTATPVGSNPQQMAWIARALDLRPEYFQKVKLWVHSTGSAKCIHRSTIDQFHELCVDRVTKDLLLLPPVTHVPLDFDPFVGRKPDGTIDAAQRERHDAHLRHAQQLAMQASGSGIEAKLFKQAFNEVFWETITTMGRYPLNGVLGTASASDFHEEQEFYQLALTQPSEQTKLLYRMIRDRQTKGHPRIVVYSESTVMLQILKEYCIMRGHCGRLSMFTGEITSARKRTALIEAFLSPANPKGIFFISSAGSVGVTLVPGCRTMFCFGDMPWNHRGLEQAQGRIDRIGQDGPVEIVQFTPRRGVAAAKLDRHIDHADRLEAAMRDRCYTKFKLDASEQWRLRSDLIMNLSTLDEQGNYKETQVMNDLLEEWRDDVAKAKEENLPLPPKPQECIMPPAVLADDIELPPVTYPVEGFVEPDVKDEDASVGGRNNNDDDDDDDAVLVRPYPEDMGAEIQKLLDKNAAKKAAKAEAKLRKQLGIATPATTTGAAPVTKGRKRKAPPKTMTKEEEDAIDAARKQQKKTPPPPPTQRKRLRKAWDSSDEDDSDDSDDSDVAVSRKRSKGASSSDSELQEASGASSSGSDSDDDDDASGEVVELSDSDSDEEMPTNEADTSDEEN